MAFCYKNDIRITDSRSISRVLQRVLNGLMKEEGQEGYIPIANARAIIYGCSVLSKNLENIEIVERIDRLEEVQKGA